MEDLIIKVYSAMVDFYRGDPKRIQHFIKVHSLSRQIGLQEGLDARALYILELAALVHDIGIKPAEAKYHSSMGKYQELEGPAEARTLLTACGVDSEAVERICFLVGHHHTYKDIQGADYQILVEADFLVNIFEDDLPAKSAEAVRGKIFRTAAGRRLLTAMYALPEDNTEA